MFCIIKSTNMTLRSQTDIFGTIQENPHERGGAQMQDQLFWLGKYKQYLSINIFPADIHRNIHYLIWFMQMGNHICEPNLLAVQYKRISESHHIFGKHLYITFTYITFYSLCRCFCPKRLTTPLNCTLPKQTTKNVFSAILWWLREQQTASKENSCK